MDQSGIDSAHEDSTDRLDNGLLSEIEEEGPPTPTHVPPDVNNSKYSHASCGSASIMDLSGGGGGNVEQQLVMIEEMVHEMKQGFVIAMEELTKIQEGDHHLHREMQEHRDSVDRIVSSFREEQTNHKSELLSELRKEIQEDRGRHQKTVTDMIAALKGEVSAVSGHLQEVLHLQKGLQVKVDTLTSERDLLLEELVRNGAVSDQIRQQLMKNNGAASEHMEPSESNANEGDDGPTMEDDVTASACKCLSLLQALEERCVLPDLSDSSDDDVTARPDKWRQNPSDGNSGPSVAAPEAYSDYQTADTAERQQSVQDIVDSEREYCTQLWALLNGYLTPLQEGLYVSTRELNILFPAYLSQMYDEHCHILNLLEERLQHWSWGGLVGDVFARMTDTQTGNLISLYKEYLADFPDAVNCLRRQITQSRKFRAFIKREDHPNSGDIVSLLTAPIRRIPQYSLLLQQLLKNTPGSHPDHYTLQSTLARLRGFVDQFSDEITHTVSQDKETAKTAAPSFRSSPSGSSCDTGQPPSARDSGIHSNGEEPHVNYPSNRSYTPDWVEMTSKYREDRLPPPHSRLSARSQPDLTFGRHSTGQMSLPQGYTGDGYYNEGPAHLPISDKISHHKRYKMKKKGDRQGGYYRNPTSVSHPSLPPDYATSYNLSTARLRPSSAIDFISRQDSPQVRQNRSHLHNRPQSAMGVPNMYGSRNRQHAPHQMAGRRHHDGSTGSMNMSMPSSAHSMVNNPVHTQMNNSLPVSRSFSPSPRESPRILVNGRKRDIYVDQSHGQYYEHNYGVYGDEEHQRYPYDSHRHFVDNRQLDARYPEGMELAVSLADSLNDNTSASQPVSEHGSVSHAFHGGIQGPTTDHDGKEVVPSHEANTSHSKSDRSMHASDLQLNLAAVQDAHSDIEEPNVQKTVYTDSSDQPNSSFEDSARSESRNSEQKTEESSEVVLTSQSQSPEHSSHSNQLSEAATPVNDRDRSGPRPVPHPHAQGNNESRDIFSHLRNNHLEPNSFENSVLSFDERMLSNHKPLETGTNIVRKQSDRTNVRSRNTNRLSSPFPQPRPADYAPDLQNSTSTEENDSVQGKKETKKKKKETKRYNSMENLSKSTEDVSSKRTFKSSLKHFFGKKKGSVRMDKLEAQFAKEHGIDHSQLGLTAKGEKGENSVNHNNNNDSTKGTLVTLAAGEDQPCSTA